MLYGIHLPSKTLNATRNIFLLNFILTLFTYSPGKLTIIGRALLWAENWTMEDHTNKHECLQFIEYRHLLLCSDCIYTACIDNLIVDHGNLLLSDIIVNLFWGSGPQRGCTTCFWVYTSKQTKLLKGTTFLEPLRATCFLKNYTSLSASEFLLLVEPLESWLCQGPERRRYSLLGC